MQLYRSADERWEWPSSMNGNGVVDCIDCVEDGGVSVGGRIETLQPLSHQRVQFFAQLQLVDI